MSNGTDPSVLKYLPGFSSGGGCVSSSRPPSFSAPTPHLIASSPWALLLLIQTQEPAVSSKLKPDCVAEP